MDPGDKMGLYILPTLLYNKGYRIFFQFNLY